MQDYYQILGLTRSASSDDIKRSYRKLASQHHPDKGGDKGRFQEIEEAYRILSDPEKRREYDNPNIHINHFDHSPNFDFDSIYSMFGAKVDPRERMRPVQRLTLWLRLEDIVRKGTRQAVIATRSGTSTIDIDVPTGVEDGEMIRYQGLAPNGQDLVVQFRIQPHAFWQRQRNDIWGEYRLDFWQMILGCEASIKGLMDETLSFVVPAKTKPGTVLRLKNKGLADRRGNTGDIMLKLQPMLPDYIPDELVDYLKKILNK